MENFMLAINGLRSNKMRALLTMLGIIIGIASVIGIMTIGQAMTNSVNSSLSSMGTNNIYLMLEAREQSDNINDMATKQPAKEDYITGDMMDRLRDRFKDDITGISATASGGSDKIEDSYRYAKVSYSGVTADEKDISNIKMISGRFLSERDVKGARNVAVVSDRFVKNMYRGDYKAALGKEFTAHMTNGGLTTLTIIGVYEYQPNAMMAMSPMLSAQADDKDATTMVYAPISTVQNLTGNDDGYQYIIVTAKSSDTADALGDKIADWMTNTYYDKNNDFKISSMSMKASLDTVNSLLSTLSLAIAIIGGISLLVGGIGVMNIMLVSVTERTREIGTRKALGAPNSAIRSQFIIESVVICLIGGIIGIIVGAAGGIAGSNLMGYPAYPPISSIVVAFTFSMAIGIFFGYYPANKAAKLDPIEALRYE